jgi:hypothetical protein
MAGDLNGIFARVGPWGFKDGSQYFIHNGAILPQYFAEMDGMRIHFRQILTLKTALNVLNGIFSRYSNNSDPPFTNGCGNGCDGRMLVYIRQNSFYSSD